MPSPSTSLAGGRGTLRNSVAAVVVAVPPEFVKTARNCLPLSAAVAPNEYTLPVAPGTLATAPRALPCHCPVGVGFPGAAAWRVAAPPTDVNTFDGLVVTVGGVLVGGGVGKTLRIRLLA